MNDQQLAQLAQQRDTAQAALKRARRALNQGTPLIAARDDTRTSRRLRSTGIINTSPTRPAFVPYHPSRAAAQLAKRDGNTCWICHQPFPARSLHVDHIIPVARGGTNNPANLALACQPCNLRKADRIVAVHIATRQVTYLT